MPQFNCKIVLILLACSVIMFSACTEAKRFLDDKTDAKATPTPRTSDASSALKTSPSPAASASPKAMTAAATFSGDIAGKTGKRLLYQLLEKNSKKPIKLDLLLSDEQLDQMNDVNKGQRWYFDLAYEGQDGFNTGGELLIDIAKGKGDLKLSGNHLTGNIIVMNWSGPKQGLMSISAKPASGETANVSKSLPRPSEKPSPKKSSNDANVP